MNPACAVARGNGTSSHLFRNRVYRTQRYDARQFPATYRLVIAYRRPDDQSRHQGSDPIQHEVEHRVGLPLNGVPL